MKFTSERNPCEIIIPITTTSSDRLKQVLENFEDYGMLLWQKPSYGGYDNEMFGKQLFSDNVKLSPVFTLIWNAWIHDLGIENHFMQIRDYFEVPSDEPTFNFLAFTRFFASFLFLFLFLSQCQSVKPARTC